MSGQPHQLLIFSGFHGLLLALSTAPCPSAFGRRLKCGDFREFEEIVVNSQERLETGVGSWNLELGEDCKSLVEVYTGTFLGVSGRGTFSHLP